MSELLKIKNVKFVNLTPEAIEKRDKAGINSKHDWYMVAEVIKLDERRRQGLNKVSVVRVFWPDNKSDFGTINGIKDILVAEEVGGLKNITDLVINEKDDEEPVVYNTEKCEDAILDGYLSTVATADVCDKGKKVVNTSGHDILAITVAVLGAKAKYNGLHLVESAWGEKDTALVHRMIQAREGNIYTQVEDPNYDGGSDDYLNSGISPATQGEQVKEVEK